MCRFDFTTGVFAWFTAAFRPGVLLPDTARSFSTYMLFFVAFDARADANHLDGLHKLLVKADQVFSQMNRTEILLAALCLVLLTTGGVILGRKLLRRLRR